MRHDLEGPKFVRKIKAKPLLHLYSFLKDTDQKNVKMMAEYLAVTSLRKQHNIKKWPSHNYIQFKADRLQ